MLAYAREAVDLAHTTSRADLDTNRLMNLSLVRLVEIVGEAANRVPEAIQHRYADIPWTHIVGLRNRLIHAYDAIDFDILWQVLIQDLPPLITRLEQIDADLEHEQATNDI